MDQPSNVWTSSPFLRERALTVYAAALAARHVTGAIVELGVGQGHTAKVLAALAAQWGKDLILVDAFGTSPLPLRDRDGAHAAREYNSFASLRDTINAVPPLPRQTLCLLDLRHYHSQDPWAFVHVDVDLYESTRDAVSLVRDRLVSRGIVVFDDYGDTLWPGVQDAVDELLPPSWWRYRVDGICQLVAVNDGQ